MSPTVPESEIREDVYCRDGSSPDDIVITGMSGRFPNSDNIEELSEGLYQMKNLSRPVEERWEQGSSELEHKSIPILKCISSFDSDFFRVPGVMADNFEPEQRLLLEVVYEAISDSGYDPQQMRGRKIGVYCASTNMDSTQIWLAQRDCYFYAITVLESMRANRISHYFDFKGPSYCIDSACSSSAVALHNAFRDMRDGVCESAIVCGAQLTLNPQITRVYTIGGICSPTESCFPFEENANGMVRSEAVAALFIQKASVARRSYAKIKTVQIRSNGYSPEGIAHPLELAQKNLFNSVIKECNLEANKIPYIECHGTGTFIGDPIEINSVNEVYCQNRKDQLLIGTAKSNLGHSEAPSGICSVMKAIMAFETGLIAPHYNYKRPSPHCLPLLDGSIKVVSEPMPLKGDWILVNSFGFGGTIGQIALQTTAPKMIKGDSDDLPQLVLHSATSEDGVSHGLNYILKQAASQEFSSFVNNLAFTDPSYKSYRGFALMSKEPQSESKQCCLQKREVWFVMTGMGCQWPGMGYDLMKIETFARSIKKSAQVVKPLGIDLLSLMKPESNELSRKRTILPAFVGICAIQIALIDVLRELGIEADGIIGHSVGELACAYADGCCTAEQTILSAYWRGYSTENSNLPEGAMAAVGMTWEEAMARCPKDVYAACHNAEDSVTISGLKKPIEDFIAQLKQENRFARVVDTYGYLFHSPVMVKARGQLQDSLEKVITKPKLRSSRWLSTSYPPEDWEKPEAKIADPSYFVHNLLSQVRFAEAAAHIPKDAITIEIGPHALLQSLLKKVIGPEASHIGLMRRHENNVNVLLSNIGRLYTTGINPKIGRLYPTPQYPVSRGTPVVSNLIKWNHTFKYCVPRWQKSVQGCTKVIVDPTGDDQYILDHCIDGRSLYPAAGYIYLAWLALAKHMNKTVEQLAIVIEDFMIHRASILSPTDQKTYNISLLGVGGEFEIAEGNSVIASGKISCLSESVSKLPTPTYTKQSPLNLVTGKEVYSELKINGYEYGSNFQALIEATLDGSQGLLKYDNKWIPYLDAHLLFFGLIHESHKFYLPTGVLSIKIDPMEMTKYLNDEQLRGCEGMPVNFKKYTGTCYSPGVEIRKLKADQASRSNSGTAVPFLEQIHFVPYVESCAITESKKREYEEYIAACCEMAKQISVSSTDNIQSSRLDVKSNHFSFKQFLSCDDGSYVLLQMLQEFLHVFTSDNFINDVKTIFRRYADAAGEDLLYQTLHDQYPLRHILSTVMENSPSRMTIAEVANGALLFAPIIAGFIKTISTSKAKFTVLHPDPEVLDSVAFAEKNIDVQALRFAQRSRNVKNQNLVISSFFFGDATVLQSHIRLLVSMTQPKGFILLLHRERISPAEAFLCSLCDEAFQTQPEATLRHILNLENLTVISVKSDSFGSTLYLLRRKDNTERYNDSVVKVKDGCYNEWIGELKDAFAKANDEENARLWIVAEDSPFNGIVGMAKCLNKEPGGEKIRCVFVVKDRSSQSIKNFSLEEPFYKDIKQNDLLMNVYKDGMWGAFQSSVVPYEVEERLMEHSYLNIKKYGDLSSFQWFELPIKYTTDRNSNRHLVQIYYSALNFHDVMLATGKLNTSALSQTGEETCLLGMEYSGIAVDGRRVMCVADSHGIATSAFAHPVYCHDVPDHWSLEEAATVPVIYLTSYYALIMRAGLSEGDSILIHSGTGGIGISAIRIALSMHCKIFVTVGTNEKKSYLKRLFPEIEDSHISSSRDTQFEDLILNKTHGKGVKAILNSLADDKFKASVRCVARDGHFIEIGKYDLSLDRKLGLNFFLQNISFHGISMEKFLSDALVNPIRLLQLNTLLCDGIKNGVVQPLERTIFQRDEVEDAFRYMASGKHIGKVLMKIRDEPSSKEVVPSIQNFKASPCTYFYSNKSYIVIGGLGGFGLELVKWMQRNGARNIVLTSRFGIQTGYHKLCLQRWNEYGINVTVSVLDVSKRSEAKQLLGEVNKIAPIGGIINSAVVLKDAFMENQTDSDFAEACAPKAEATKNLDELSRVMCPALDYFICFSSISCGKGNAGQSNYGYANSVMERVCERRRGDGLHGLCIQWGIIGDVGLVHRHMGEDAVIAGVVSQKIMSCLDVLSQFLQRECAVLSSYNIVDDSKRKKVGKDDFLPQIAKVFGCKDVSQMNTTRSFIDMGFDSLIGVELQQLLESRYDLNIAMKDLQNMNVEELQRLIEATVTEKSDVKDYGIAQAKNLFIPPDVLVSEKQVSLLNAKVPGKSVFLVHHSEAELKRLHSLAENINATVYGLQCNRGTPIDGLSSLGMAYLKDITKVNDSGSIHLIGYRSAVTLALQMAIDCLNKNSTKLPSLASVMILDGSLDLVNAFQSAEESDLKAADESILLDYLTQYSDGDLSKIKEEIQSLPDFESQVSYVINLLAASWQEKFDKVAISDSVHRFVNVQRLMKKFEVKQKIPIDISVVEVTGKLLPNDVSVVKATLSKICGGKVSINRIPGDSNFLAESETTTAMAKVINKIIGCETSK